MKIFGLLFCFCHIILFDILLLLILYINCSDELLILTRGTASGVKRVRVPPIGGARISSVITDGIPEVLVPRDTSLKPMVSAAAFNRSRLSFLGKPFAREKFQTPFRVTSLIACENCMGERSRDSYGESLKIRWLRSPAYDPTPACRIDLLNLEFPASLESPRRTSRSNGPTHSSPSKPDLSDGADYCGARSGRYRRSR